MAIPFLNTQKKQKTAPKHQIDLNISGPAESAFLTQSVHWERKAVCKKSRWSWMVNRHRSGRKWLWPVSWYYFVAAFSQFELCCNVCRGVPANLADKQAACQEDQHTRAVYHGIWWFAWCYSFLYGGNVGCRHSGVACHVCHYNPHCYYLHCLHPGDVFGLNNFSSSGFKLFIFFPWYWDCKYIIYVFKEKLIHDEILIKYAVILQHYYINIYQNRS